MKQKRKEKQLERKETDQTWKKEENIEEKETVKYRHFDRRKIGKQK